MPETKKTLTEDECRVENKYFCPTCEGWKLSAPRREPYNDIGFLCGSAGVLFLCVDCGTVVGAQVSKMS